MRSGLSGFLIVLLFASCAVSKSYSPTKKYAPEVLKEDYHIFRASLQESHPSLYWYTPKDSMDFYFTVGESRLTDSLTEGQFRNVLSYVISKIRCGHTTVRSPRGETQFSDRRNSAFPLQFPLYVKAWPDTMVVTANLNRKDSVLTRGAILKAIDGKPIKTIVDSMFSFLSADGYNLTHKYQTLSNGSTFRNLYAALFGLKRQTAVEFIDVKGEVRTSLLSLYNPRADTPRRAPLPAPMLSKKERRKLELESMRSLRIDTALSTAFMELNTFVKGYKLRRFFKQSFKKVKQLQIANLVMDIRGNGGGSVVLSNLLTRYIADAPFVIADSLYAVKRTSEFGKYRNTRFFNWLFLQFLTRKRKDGYYHFGLYERKKFALKTKNHFNGTTYIVTGGNTFSAASLVAKSVQNQKNVVIVGEETGGGAYGNTAWLIPDLTLPNTGVGFRLPLFRLVIDKTEVKGSGVQPDVYALPTVEAIRKSKDYKMDKVRELIKAKQ